jgi:serine/threonine protein kinase
VAVKRFHPFEEDEEKFMGPIRNEVSHMAALNHENIIKILGVALHVHSPCILLEFAEHGSLKQLMYSEFQYRYPFLLLQYLPRLI